ncbi:MAG: TIGR03364 family FAD-dependent oxidoreductase [Candidatus Binatus sp.]|uniref:TIGR03364 family FAD-dependent oxidoreductase n=1 Tax=Candidatus Binatus sp. TaxID=2811406 RepID=UPI003BB02082
MSSNRKVDVAIVGAGILGLAHAYFAAKRGRSVVVFERTPRAQGASVRNFGMIWPIGQRAGVVHQMATRSRQIWNEILDEAALQYRPTGSLHVVYRQDEEDVAREFVERGMGFGYTCSWLSPAEVLKKSSSVNPKGLLGGIWSPAELTVDPRQILAKLPAYLAEKFGVRFRFGTAVRSIQLPRIEAGAEIWEATQAIVCGGDDFETLFPELFAASGIDRCKLQMMRTAPQKNGWELGPALAAGLTLRFYPAFEICTETLPKHKERVAREMAEYDRFAIHTLVSQTADGALTLGDSHEYGLAVNIFNKTEIDELVMRNVREFLVAPDLSIAERWYGVYAKHPEKSWVAIDAAPGVRIVTAVGGSGMTLSFGLAEQMIREMHV